MDISPKFQMNLHPKDADNLSLVTSRNIKLSNDGSCITNEESIKENDYINTWLTDYYANKYRQNTDFNIVGIIPCNNELVLICVSSYEPDQAQIFRYREKTSNQEEALKCVYGDKNTNYLKYYNGKIKGTFTYNVENSLIIAIAEYDGNEEKIPLRTINLGNFDNDTIYNDNNVPDNLLSVAPEVRIPNVTNIKYITGNAYKGWYYLFIRYKINSIDYTQWFSFGRPIYIDTLEEFAITKYCYQQNITGFTNDGAFAIVRGENPSDGYCAGASDYFSNTSDIANETFTIDFEIYKNDYIKYQIGLICSSKSYTKAFRTADIDIESSPYNVNASFTLNNAALIEASAEEFIIDNYNYFDVKNIINYQNRLYISNYKENNANDDYIINSNLLDEININLYRTSVTGSSVKRDCTISTNQSERSVSSNQYIGFNSIPASDYFNMDELTDVTISGTATCVNSSDMSHFSAFRQYNVKLRDITIELAYTYNEQTNTFGKYIPSCIAFQLYDYDNVLSDKVYPIISFDNTVTIDFQKSDYSVETHSIRCTNYAMNGGITYINPDDSFDSRKNNPIFIPGEVYNFFIHFVDKYGHCTNGYRIENKNKWTTEDNTDEICPITFRNSDKKTIYAAVSINSKLLDEVNNINTYGIKFYQSANNYKLTNRITDDSNILEQFTDYFSSFRYNTKYENVYWYQIANGFEIDDFMPYINNNEERLFRFPAATSENINRCGYDISIDHIKIPKGYIGYFISYEKFEPCRRVTGMLTRNDFRSKDYVQAIDGSLTVLATVNTLKSDKMFFYSEEFDISDSIRLDYNIMSIEGVNIFDEDDIPDWDYAQRCNNYKVCHDMNKPQVGSNNMYCPATYAIPEYKLCVADSAADERMGVGTALQLKDSYNLFPIYSTTSDTYGKINIYRATLYNMSRDLYMSNNKTLIRCSEIIYPISYTAEITDCSISRERLHGNGYSTYCGVIVYENAGFNFNTANNIVYRFKENNKYYASDGDKLHTYQVNCPFLAYVQYGIIDTYFHESKCFKNEPTPYVFYVHRDNNNLDAANENNKFQPGCIVTPSNSIDLFENRQSSSDTFYTKTYTNYREDLVSVDNFNKTVRRSAVIQDETRANGWRSFPVEGYKNITENKGIITNLVGIGTMLLVHTEHSLFMFNTDNTLTTNESQKIQLTQPDAFEVNYIEVLTSSLGYGGLQDDKAFIVDQFGYTFYNNDFHRFYNFDNGQLNVIDDDIIQWLDKYKPYNVRFANDKFNNRLIIKMNYIVTEEEKEVLLSYNYGVNHFVSTHDYTFEEAFNTKYKLYMKCPSKSHANCSLHEFVQDGSSYGNFDNGQNAIGDSINYPAKIGIIINEQYDNIKFLEHITYKLNKLANPTKFDYTNSPVEEMITPYSADLLKIYNNEVNTGELNILIYKEEAKNVFCDYTKPYWELGNWNYSYLRNKISEHANYGDAFNMSRLFGNYFVVEFTFSNTDNLKVEFEELKYSITK